MDYVAEEHYYPVEKKKGTADNSLQGVILTYVLGKSAPLELINSSCLSPTISRVILTLLPKIKYFEVI